ncbi:alpha/beta-hydrolase [Dacryopinax primogenitus]|uniref:Alpha/beta-hydrolase n=1 Tax=Dacryopinax primogenitus (strain DJM 731) TaxID=1858805 RepID=M5G9S2_DACPD|nr:alpha/beta-hydrolase [Dacryopinax primogenitus]EJU05559.1 alpha/beta-hydrolase [Dacryopinax primogenitus]
MSLYELLDVQYDTAASGEAGSSGHAQRRLDLFVPPVEAPPLLVFVHGGAWRSGDKSEHTALARSLALQHSTAVAVVNYRLTERNPPPGEMVEVRHPMHALDVLLAIEFLYDWAGEGEGKPELQKSFDREKLYFIGHSCGAHILTTLFLYPPALSLPPTPSHILRSTHALLLAEGIYSLPLLLETFPSYIEFIAPPFGGSSSGSSSPGSKYDIFSANHYDLRPGGEHMHWWVVHSEGDELVDFEQPEVMFDSLEILLEGEEGEVHQDWDTLKGDHYKTLDEPRFSEIVGEMLAV